MPLHPIGIAFYLTIIVFLVTLVVVAFIRSAKIMRIVGYIAAGLVFLSGAVFSVMMHLLHVGMSGDPADSPLPIMLLITLGLTTPVATFTYFRSRQLTRRPGCCVGCGYDLRGSAGSQRCPECGESIDLTSLRS